MSVYMFGYATFVNLLDNKGEKVDRKCFCKDCNLCLCIIFTDKTRTKI